MTSEFTHVADAYDVSSKLFLNLKVELFEVRLLLVDGNSDDAGPRIRRSIRREGYVEDRNRKPRS